MLTVHEVVKLPIGQLREAPWNANKTSKAKLEKVRNSLKEFGIVENNVCRPDWTIGCKIDTDIEARRSLVVGRPSFYETLSGNHRLGLYREAGMTHVQSVVVEVTDAKAAILAQALNR